MNTQSVQLNIDFGHPEVLQIGGITMILFGLYIVGGVFCGIGAFTAFARSAIRIQRAQAEIQAKQEVLNQIGEAGGELASALSTLFGSQPGNKSVVH